jgi:hypothetical protein
LDHYRDFVDLVAIWLYRRICCGRTHSPPARHRSHRAADSNSTRTKTDVIFRISRRKLACFCHPLCAHRIRLLKCSPDRFRGFRFLLGLRVYVHDCESFTGNSDTPIPSPSDPNSILERVRRTSTRGLSRYPFPLFGCEHHKRNVPGAGADHCPWSNWTPDVVKESRIPCRRSSGDAFTPFLLPL